jgi:hypothetical protein
VVEGICPGPESPGLVQVVLIDVATVVSIYLIFIYIMTDWISSSETMPLYEGMTGLNLYDLLARL